MTEANKYYLQDGEQTDQASDTNIIAKAILSRKPRQIVSNPKMAADRLSYRYYIKTDNDNNPLNPIKNKTLTHTNTSKYIDKVCRTRNEFREVNQYVFDKYIQFLQTKNIKWLKDTIRDLA